MLWLGPKLLDNKMVVISAVAHHARAKRSCSHSQWGPVQPGRALLTQALTAVYVLQSNGT
jgi:hypothetical protein